MSAQEQLGSIVKIPIRPHKLCTLFNYNLVLQQHSLFLLGNLYTWLQHRACSL
jgi:hypothetical protein